MPNKRKYISTEYGMVNLRDGDTILHLDPELLADIYWRVLDGELTEVVRCKDCIHSGQCTKEIVMKMRVGSYLYCPMGSDGFCSLGERRKDAETN